MNSKQEDTVKLFRELGWEKATSNNVLDLPVGTSEQKKKAIEGFKSGDWFDIKEEVAKIFNVNYFVLIAFAIRIGIEEQRIVSIMPWIAKDDNDSLRMLETVIAARGDAFANRFILSACKDSNRPLLNAPTRFAKLVVALVHNIPLPVPQNVGYIKDWAGGCAPNQRGWEFDGLQITSKELQQKVKQRFEEHVQTAVDVGATVTGPMKEMLKWGIEQKCISKDKLSNLAITALNTPIRPADRKIWLEVLDLLQVSDEGLCKHIDELLPVLSMGEAPVINRFAPLFIENVDDNTLVPLLMACFSGSSNKTRKIVLEAALKRERPQEAEQLTEWLAQLCIDGDTKTIKLAQKLLEKWNLETTTKQEEAKVSGCWQPTPPLWKVPDFSLGETTFEALTQLAAKLMGQADVVGDINMERFIALANMLAYKDSNEVRLSLRGLKDTKDNSVFISNMCNWVQGKQMEWGADDSKHGIKPLFSARNYIVTFHLGEQPCLLSTPSKDDLSIKPEDLLNRLKIFEQKNIKAQEADLYLAMTRLIPEKLSENKKSDWESIDVLILLQSGKTMSITAGQAVLNWLSNPTQEPALKQNNNKHWFLVSNPVDAPEFPHRLSSPDLWRRDGLISIFPLWGDASLMSVVWWSWGVNHRQGLDLRQVARHNAPFSGSVMLNMLAAQRTILARDAVEDSRLAVMEAWQRGLLRPVPIDVNKYDWRNETPEQLVAFSVYLDEIAQQGLLSLVWIVADTLILASCKASRMYSGTAEMAELIRRYLPEAKEAIKKGIVDSTILDLPGIRLLAFKKGKSAAVVAAKAVVEQLPEISEKKQYSDNKQDKELDPPFDIIWPKPGEPYIVPDDKVSIDVVQNISKQSNSKKGWRFILTLPNQEDCVYHMTINGWVYGIEEEGQSFATKTKPNAPWPDSNGTRVWLHWDTKTKKLIASNQRNWETQKDEPTNCKRAPLSFSLIVVAIGALGNGAWHDCYSQEILNILLKNHELDATIMKRVIQVILKSPDVNPALMVRFLEESPDYLFIMWPILTQSVMVSGKKCDETGKPPAWVNRILDVSIRNAPYLKEATKRGYIQSVDAKWNGLSSIANCKARSTAVGKAKQLAELLGIKLINNK